MAKTEPIAFDKCPHCQCGVERDPRLCAFCGAILESSNRSMTSITASAVLCFDCGAENSLLEAYCKDCHKKLLQSCPRCDEGLFEVSASFCPQCYLRRGEFFSYTCQKRRSVETTAEKQTAIGNKIFFSLLRACSFWWLGTIMKWATFLSATPPSRSDLSGSYCLSFLSSSGVIGAHVNTAYGHPL